MATDDEILALLRDMRDIQKQYVESYRAHSERAISMTIIATNRQRKSQWMLFAFCILFPLAVYKWPPSNIHEWEAIQRRAQEQLDQKLEQLDQIEERLEQAEKQQQQWQKLQELRNGRR